MGCLLKNRWVRCLCGMPFICMIRIASYLIKCQFKSKLVQFFSLAKTFLKATGLCVVTSEKGIYSTLKGNNYICEMSG